MRSRLHRILAWLGLALFPSFAGAQADSANSYDVNALRVESRFGDLRIIRGVNGPAVGSVGTLRTVNLVKLVGPSENAVKEAREFERNQRPGSVAALLGTIVLGTSIAVSTRNDPSWGLISAEVAGVGLLFYGGIRLNRAYNALSRSIWWYNRDLRR